MQPSKPELEGWVDREKLLDISGRSRDIQLQMAKDIELKDFESPGGGCLLTDIQFSNRLRDFADNDKLEVEDIDTLKAGRHFRLPDGSKLIIGRHQEDNEKLKATNSDKYYKARILNATGPLALMQKDATQNDKELAANLIVTYGKTNTDQEYEVKLFDENDDGDILKGIKFPTKDIASSYLVK